MRIAVISDIHGNLNALERVIERIHTDRADGIVCLGDVVGYGPFPNECVDIVRDSCPIVVRGNHDAGAIGLIPSTEFNTEGRAAIEWTQLQITSRSREFLQKLPTTFVSNGVTYAHASPKEPGWWHYVATWEDALEVFEHFNTPFCCIGHTHIPAIVAENGMLNLYQNGQRHLINAGSVGQPRDGNPHASYASVDTDRGIVRIIRVAYDVGSTANAIRHAGLPEFLARRLEHGI